MGKVTKQRARKDWRCSKCGTIIKKGEEYYALRVNYHPVRRRCIKCGFKGWELSGSYYVRTIGELRDSLEAMEPDYVLNDFELHNIEEELTELSEHLETSIDNVPENLAESAPVQDRQYEFDSVEEFLYESLADLENPTAAEILELMKHL